MKDKRIWIVIGCILVIGTGVTHYTKYYVKNQASVTMEAAASAGDIPAGAPNPASAPEVQDRAAEGGAAPGAAAGGTAAEKAVPSERSLSSAASAPPGPGAAPAAAADGMEESHADETMAASDETGASREAAEAEAAQIYSDDDVPVEAVPISPLTGAQNGEIRSYRMVDYKQRLLDLDTQIQKMREQETDSNVYSIKTSAETELKMWESEMNTIYNSLLESLGDEEAAKLAAEQQNWMKSWDAKAAESSGNNSVSVEGIGYAATLVSLTRDRAYELAGRYEDANGVKTAPKEEASTSVSGQ